jgi:hypothetical protein
MFLVILVVKSNAPAVNASMAPQTMKSVSYHRIGSGNCIAQEPRGRLPLSPIPGESSDFRASAFEPPLYLPLMSDHTHDPQQNARDHQRNQQGGKAACSV